MPVFFLAPLHVLTTLAPFVTFPLVEPRGQSPVFSPDEPWWAPCLELTLTLELSALAEFRG